MSKFQVGDMTNGNETSSGVIEAESELEALRKMIAITDTYCKQVPDDTEVTIEL